jgi:hypothetical protein
MSDAALTPTADNTVEDCQQACHTNPNCQYYAFYFYKPDGSKCSLRDTISYSAVDINDTTKSYVFFEVREVSGCSGVGSAWPDWFSVTLAPLQLPLNRPSDRTAADCFRPLCPTHTHPGRRWRLFCLQCPPHRRSRPRRRAPVLPHPRGRLGGLQRPGKLCGLPVCSHGAHQPVADVPGH